MNLLIYINGRSTIERVVYVVLLSLFIWHLEAQPFIEIELDDEQHRLQRIEILGEGTNSVETAMPLISFDEDGLTYTSTEPGKLKVDFRETSNYQKVYQGIVTLANPTNDTVILSNVIPFGKENKRSYITGLGDHRLSRSHLFLPDKSPINCILPDNAWELGYSDTKLTEETSLCALARRDGVSIQNGQRKRFETILFPGGSVQYKLYAEPYQGSWQNGLKRVFQEKFLYEVDDFDDALYERGDLGWIRKSYIIHLIMAWNRIFYDGNDGGYKLMDFLKKGKRLYGGDDIVGIWPTWPTLGLDERNQFDLYRDLPGGLSKLRALSDSSRRHGTSLFIAYNPWDESTREEGHLQGMVDLLRDIEADGVILDTWGESNREFQDAADSVKPGIVMYSEGMAVTNKMQNILAGRVHNALYYPPLFNLNKLIKPDFAIFRVAELYKEPIQRELAISFFNGHGIEFNVFAPGMPSWLEQQYRYVGKTSRILRENTTNFTSDLYKPLISTEADFIYVNKWPSREKVIYTILNLIPEGFNGSLFEVDAKEGHHYVDIWHHRELSTLEKDGRHFVDVVVDGFNSSLLGTNNEGEVSCIAEFPILLQSELKGDQLNFEASKGDVIKIWAGQPDYEKVPYESTALRGEVSLLKVFGAFEGKIIVQLFEKDELIDENVLFIKPGTPRLASRVTRIFEEGPHKGMSTIPAGTFTFDPSNGDEFIPYPSHNHGLIYQMDSFLMDQHPVTNAQFKEFVDATEYRPKDTNRFLMHWDRGDVPEGLEDHPVVYVSYEDAQAYARWAHKRLPTEIEWQYAAQTTDLREWPWSRNTSHIGRKEERITQTLTVFKIFGIDSTLCNIGNGTLDPVGTYPQGANPYGLQDLVGSVWQLTNDHYQSGSYDYIIMKGGSFFNPSSSWWYIQGGPRELHYRQHLLRVSPGFERNATVGFRCVRDL